MALTLFPVIVPAQISTLDISFNVLDSYIEVGESFGVEVFAKQDIGDGDLLLFGFDVDPSAALSLFTYGGYAVGAGFLDEI